MDQDVTKIKSKSGGSILAQVVKPQPMDSAPHERQLEIISTSEMR